MSPAPLSRIAVIVLTAAVLALYFRHRLFATTVPLITIQVVAVLLMLWARLTFGWRSFHGIATPTEGGLVTKGPYAYIRNPIYAASLLFMWAGVVAHAAPLPVGPAIIASAALSIRIATEERLVARRYPDYAAYAAKTRRLIPGVF